MENWASKKLITTKNFNPRIVAISNQYSGCLAYLFFRALAKKNLSKLNNTDLWYNIYTVTITTEMLFLNWDEYLFWSEREKDDCQQVLAEPWGKKDDNVCDITTN